MPVVKNKNSKAEMAKRLFQNIKNTLKIAWQTDRSFFCLIATLGLLIALFPIALSYSFKLVIDGIIKSQGQAAGITVVLFSLFAFRYLLDIFYDFIMTYRYEYLDRIFRYKLENFLTLNFVRKISELDMPYFESSESQSLIKKAREGYTWRIPDFINSIVYISTSVGTLIGSFLVLLPFGYWIPAVMIIATIPRYLLRNKYSKVSWSIFNQNINESKDLGYISDILDDPVSVKEIRISQAGSMLLKRMKKLQDFILDSVRKPLRNYLASFYFPALLEMLVLFFLAYLKLPSVVAKIITLGSFTFYIQMLDRISSSAQQAVSQMSNLYENNLYVGYYFDVLALPKIIHEKEPGYEFEEITPPRIEFRNVSFAYPDGPKIIKNISFSLEAGEHLALVGPNGAGKSTLIKLLLRFYDPTDGQILINDVDLKDLKFSYWYKFISILFQDFVKFHLNIKDNILLGKATSIDEVKMKEAASKSGADEFIKTLPKQYNQRLGKRFEDAVDLSQGQWQKLALARAFYEEAPILILDEPTSSIDAEAEAKIFENLDNLYKDKALILISHRFSTVKNADKIIVLRQGKIIEEGNHETLMASDSVYARMFRKQARGYIE